MKLPIRIRVAVTFCAVFFVLAGALEAAAYWSVRRAIHTMADHELEARLAGIDDHIERHLKRLGWPELGTALREHPAFQPDLLYIRQQGGPVVFGGSRTAQMASANTAGGPKMETLETESQSLRILTVAKLYGGVAYELSCATDLTIAATILHRLWMWITLSLPAVLFLASGAGYWISGRALRPVSGMIAAARSIDSSNLGERIAVPATGDEVQRLAETMNAMLDRIEAGFRQMRQFTANASHELRTPVAIIRAGAEVALLRTGSDERSYRDALHRILRQAERNSELIDEMLQLARTDCGADRAAAVRTNLNKSASLACAEVQPLAEAKGVRLVFRCEGAAPEVDADDNQLRRLWVLLLDNGVKYTASGGSVTLRIFVSEGQPCCEVSDTGIGIAPEHLPHIFDRFYRVDKARSRAEGGAGLGLAIADGLARMHSARIEVHSAEGAGSTFRVVFPCPNRTEKPAIIAVAPVPVIFRRS